MSEMTQQRRHDPLVVAFAREAVFFRSIQLRIRFADGRLVVTAIGGWSILGFDKGQPTSVVVRSEDEFQVASGDHTRIAVVRDAAGNVNGAVLNPGPWEPMRRTRTIKAH